MSDPYDEGKIASNPYAQRREIVGNLVAIMDLKLSGRGMKLIDPMSRAIKSSDIHELILTDEQGIEPGDNVDRTSYIGFAEINQGGVSVVGDNALIDEKVIGHIVGFSNSHFPNHIGIVIKVEERKTGEDMGLTLDSTFVIR